MVVDVTDKGPAIGARHLQALLLFLAIVVNYIAQMNAGVAVVAMTNSKSTNPNFDEYDWDGKEISYILSSFYWGYVMTQFPGGYLCRRFGAKLTMFVSTLGSAVFAIITPLCIPFGGWQIYCVIRVIQGMFQGFLFPCIHAHLAKWSPIAERNRLGALSSNGIECGTLLAMVVSGVIASSSMGWPGTYYVSGALGICWCFLWAIFSSNTPLESRWISSEEKAYILASLSPKQEVTEGKKIPVPWKAILTSLPFWALVVARSAESWGFSTLQAEIPQYMNGVLHMDMKSNGIFSSLPFFAMWIMSYVYLAVSEILQQRKCVSLKVLRRIFNSIAFWIPAAGLIGIGFLGEEQKTFAVVLMIVVVGVNSAATIGSTLNTIDLSPNHAGILMAIVNTVANVIPIITPLLVGFIVTDEHNRFEWQIVFIISAVVFAVGNLFYITCGTTDLQPWNDDNFLLKDEEAPVVEVTWHSENVPQNTEQC